MGGRAPAVWRGETVEVGANDRECGRSERCKAGGSGVRDGRGDDFELGAQFVGQPVRLRYARADSVDDIATAA